MKNSLSFRMMFYPYVLCLVVVLRVQTGLAVDLNGKWNFVFNTDDGERQDFAVFRLDNEKVSGNWGKNEALVKGTFIDGNLELKFPFVSEEAGLQGPYDHRPTERGKTHGTLGVCGLLRYFCGRTFRGFEVI